GRSPFLPLSLVSRAVRLKAEVEPCKVGVFITPPSLVSIRQQWRSRTPPSQPAVVPAQVMCSVLTNRQIHGPSFPFCMDWNTKSPQRYALAVPSDLLCST